MTLYCFIMLVRSEFNFLVEESYKFNYIPVEESILLLLLQKKEKLRLAPYLAQLMTTFLGPLKHDIYRINLFRQSHLNNSRWSIVQIVKSRQMYLKQGGVNGA